MENINYWSRGNPQNKQEKAEKKIGSGGKCILIESLSRKLKKENHKSFGHDLKSHKKEAKVWKFESKSEKCERIYCRCVWYFV